MTTNRPASRMPDPDEVEVWCTDCNCKLFNSSIYDHPTGTVKCPNPDRCREEEEDFKNAENLKYFPLYH